ncbi:hypothetical protein GH714_006074 [Hevea brasiliensis]|uniref:Uncharacterized protein n=1 Tax=Hevea brasiliensis TaxID=3981 RepID=A0A6A6LVR5_HEVBR|nr:hypothetical protein GH714_006074 [Hevea brasiliensis]
MVEETALLDGTRKPFYARLVVVSLYYLVAAQDITVLVTMKVHKGGTERTGGRRNATGGRAAIVFFLWVLLILGQLGLFYAVHEETGKLVKSLPRKVRFLETQSFHASPSQVQSSVDIEGDSDTVYADDKRIIHTGPNPLHN